MKILPKSGKTLDYLHYENKLNNEYNNFPIGLIIIEKEDKEIIIKEMNSYACEIFELYQDSAFIKLKNQMKKFKKWENNTLQDLNLYNFIFSNHLTKEHCGTFISSLSMVYVKVKFLNNHIYLSIDNYNDERKDLQGNLVKSLKYQYLVTLYHELNNPLNALMNISDDNNFENYGVEKNNFFFEEIEMKFKQINLLVILIKMFIKNFIWYFRVIFELTNNIEAISSSKINLEYLFSKHVNKYKDLFKYKDIGYEKNFSFLKDKYISSDSKHINNFFKGIFVYLYHILPKKNGFIVSHNLLNDNKIKINFIKKIVTKEKSKNKILTDIDLNFKKQFDFSNSVQTIEITKELLLRLSNMLKLKLKFYNDDEDLILSLILTFSYEEELEEEDEIKEFTPSQKLITLNGINRSIRFHNNWHSIVPENHLNINEITSPFQASLTTIQHNNINYNYHLTISVPNENLNHNQYSNWFLSTINSNIDNNGSNKKGNQNNDIFKLENDPFIKMTKDQNPFIREITNSKLSDSFISGSISMSEYVNEEEDKKRLKNYMDSVNYHSHNQQNNKNDSENSFDSKKKNNTSFKQLNSNQSLKKYLKKNNSTFLIKKHTNKSDNNDLHKKFIKNIESINSSKKKLRTYNKNEKEGNKNIIQTVKSKTEDIKMKKKNSLYNENTYNTNNNKIINKKKECEECNDVLLCDDEEFNLSTIKNMLKKFNVNADTSTNGKECIDAILNKIKCNCGNKYYKLLFLDMMMPVMDGLEATKKIQELINNKIINDDLKIIIVSAHIEDNLINSLKEFKCIVEEVPKPLKKPKLEEILNNYYFKN